MTPFRPGILLDFPECYGKMKSVDRAVDSTISLYKPTIIIVRLCRVAEGFDSLLNSLGIVPLFAAYCLHLATILYSS